MSDALGRMFFEDIEEKTTEMLDIAKTYQAGVIAVVVCINQGGDAKFRLIRPGLSRQKNLEILERAYTWAVEQIENDPRLKE